MGTRGLSIAVLLGLLLGCAGKTHKTLSDAPSVNTAAVCRIDYTNSGTYISGKWKYVYVRVPAGEPGGGPGGTIRGRLYFDGRELPRRASHTDYFSTPWGKFAAIEISEHSGGGVWFLPVSFDPQGHEQTNQLDPETMR